MAYPNSLDNLATNKFDATVMAGDHPGHHDALASAVNAVEAELGLDPSGTFATVKARLDAIAGGGVAGHTAYVFNVITDYGAVGDGVADDTAALNAAITAAKAVNGLVYSPAGKTYRITATLTINQACALDFSGSAIKRATGSSFDMLITSGSGISITNLVLDGNRPTFDTQRIAFGGTVTGGTYTLTFGGNTTAPIAYNALAQTVQSALAALASIGAGNVYVTGGIGPGTPYVVEFINAKAGIDQALITSTSSLTGSSPTITITSLLNGAAGCTGGKGVAQTGGTATAPNIFRNVTVKGNRESGFDQATTANSYSILQNVTSTDNRYNGIASGIKAELGVIKLDSICVASSNDYAGFNFDTGLAAGSEINGSTTRNGVYGSWIKCSKARISNLISTDDDFFGVVFENNAGGAADNVGNYIEVNRTGYTAGRTDATNLEFHGAWRNNISTVVSKGSSGYGVAFARSNTNPSVGSCYNTIGTISVDGAGSFAGDSDPGIHISGGSDFNYIGNAFVRAATFALVIGEDTWPVPTPTNPVNVNTNNYIGSLLGIDCAYGGILINVGRKNRVDSAIFRNCLNIDTALAGGLVSFYPDRSSSGNGGARDSSWVADNFVQHVDHLSEKFAIAGATNANPIVITVSEDPHTFNTGDTVVISGVAGNTAANGTWVVTRLSASTFSIPVSGNGAYTSGGTAQWNKPTHIVHASANATNNTVMMVNHRGDYQTAIFSDAGVNNKFFHEPGRFVASAAFTPGSTVNGATQTIGTVTVAGAVVGDVADVAWSVVLAAGLQCFGQVTAANTVTVYITNTSGGTLTPAAGTARCEVSRRINP